MVYLKLQPFLQSSMVAREVPKFAAKYYGPYKVINRIGSTTYKFDLPPFVAICQVFHISQLNRAIHDTQAATTLPLFAIPSSLLKPEAILDR